MSNATERESPDSRVHHALLEARGALEQDPRAALTAARRAVRIPRASRTLQGLAWRELGHALKALERHDEAIRAYSRSRSLLRAAGELVEAARTEIGWTDALMYLDRYREARRVGRRALRTFLDQGDARRAGRVLMNLGNLEYRRDRPLEAVALYRQAIEHLPDDSMDPAIADYNLGNILVQTAELESAERRYRRAAGRARLRPVI